MDEILRRIRSYELALVEIAAHIDRDRIIAGLVSVGENLFGDISDDERQIRIGAIYLLRAALERFDPPEEGLHWSE